MGFLRKSATKVLSGAERDRLAVDQMRKAGADPSLAHETQHFLYVPGAKSAQQIARALRRPGRRIEVETSARKGYWLVAVIEPVVVTPASIAALRTEFEDAARPYGGEYDYWQVALANR
jgi:hypothetical protein